LAVARSVDRHKYLSYSDITSGLNPVEVIKKRSEINEINWNKIFQVIGLPIPHEVYINDHKFEHLDVMLFSNFSKYFTDIWYPSADDIEIFDSSLNYIVAIRHYGALYYKKA